MWEVGSTPVMGFPCHANRGRSYSECPGAERGARPHARMAPVPSRGRRHLGRRTPLPGAFFLHGAPAHSYLTQASLSANHIPPIDHHHILLYPFSSHVTFHLRRRNDSTYNRHFLLKGRVKHGLGVQSAPAPLRKYNHIYEGFCIYYS